MSYHIATGSDSVATSYNTYEASYSECIKQTDGNIFISENITENRPSAYNDQHGIKHFELYDFNE